MKRVLLLKENSNKLLHLLLSHLINENKMFEEVLSDWNFDKVLSEIPYLNESVDYIFLTDDVQVLPFIGRHDLKFKVVYFDTTGYFAELKGADEVFDFSFSQTIEEFHASLQELLI